MAMAEALEPMSTFIEWSNELSVGIEEIDAQHKVLVDLLNQTHEAIQQRYTAQVTNDIIDQLGEYTRVHFAVEESLMRIPLSRLRKTQGGAREIDRAVERAARETGRGEGLDQFRTGAFPERLADQAHHGNR